MGFVCSSFCVLANILNLFTSTPVAVAHVPVPLPQAGAALDGQPHAAAALLPGVHRAGDGLRVPAGAAVRHPEDILRGPAAVCPVASKSANKSADQQS